MTKLIEAAKVAMRDVVGLREGEEVLIITNFEGDVFPVARAIFDVTRELKGRPTMAVQEMKTTYTYAERLVLEAIKAEPDVLVSLSASKIGKDPFGQTVGYVGKDGKKYQHIFDKLIDGDKRVRGFWSPTTTVEMFERCVALDYNEMQATAQRLKKALDGAKEIHVTAPGGTDAYIGVKGRKPMLDDGNFRLPGLGGNLPAGEVFISPSIAGVSGTIVFDGTVDLVPEAVIPKKPVKVVLKDGYVDKVLGGVEAKGLLKVIERGEAMAREKGMKEEERNARHIGELGIGINYKAKMTGNLLEDEKVGRTVHFAIGANYDNDANAMIHQDCLVIKPNMWVDKKQVMKDGKLLV
ncbi:MAG TPA: aminopeptidase [Methanocella sp.]|uniref:aminopeptidase n=1 Tax=Methanocella sp. TaxID=2052833 RepID=UPI002C66F6B2|nr:aminopeptidase [Methanocella sp.]HTY89923.1 aminopeptidase [Methanocella sp.]